MLIELNQETINLIICTTGLLIIGIVMTYALNKLMSKSELKKQNRINKPCFV